MAKPLISYPGAKWKLYDSMVDYFPSDMEVFAEPFLGGGSVTLSVLDDTRFTNLQKIVAGDLFGEIWALWTGVQKYPEETYEWALRIYDENCKDHEEFVKNWADPSILRAAAIGDEKAIEKFDGQGDLEYKTRLWEKSTECGQELYKKLMDMNPNNMSIPERAARTFLMHRITFSSMGFSGSFGADSFNGFRRDKCELILQTAKLFKDRDVEILNASFEDTINKAVGYGKKTFIFLDPPYATQETSGLYGFKGGTHKGFPHKHFAEFVMNTHADWLITYDDSVVVRQLFAGNMWNGEPCCIKPFIIPGAYTMAGKVSEDALKGEEVYISNMDLDSVNDIGLDDF